MPVISDQVFLIVSYYKMEDVAATAGTESLIHGVFTDRQAAERAAMQDPTTNVVEMQFNQFWPGGFRMPEELWPHSERRKRIVGLDEGKPEIPKSIV